jgi:hypothetical protein
MAFSDLNGEEPLLITYVTEVSICVYNQNTGTLMAANEGNTRTFVFRDLEGTYRRGYHQAVAEVAKALEAGVEVDAAKLNAWVEGPGMRWRKRQPLNTMIEPPLLE